MNAITKVQPRALTDQRMPKAGCGIDQLIWAYWILYGRTPKNPEPDADGMYNLGELGADAPKTWERLTPYSLAKPSQ